MPLRYKCYLTIATSSLSPKLSNSQSTPPTTTSGVAFRTIRSIVFYTTQSLELTSLLRMKAERIVMSRKSEYPLLCCSGHLAPRTNIQFKNTKDGKYIKQGRLLRSLQDAGPPLRSGSRHEVPTLHSVRYSHLPPCEIKQQKECYQT